MLAFASHVMAECNPVNGHPKLPQNTLSCHNNNVRYGTSENIFSVINVLPDKYQYKLKTKSKKLKTKI